MLMLRSTDQYDYDAALKAQLWHLCAALHRHAADYIKLQDVNNCEGTGGLSFTKLP